MPTYQKCPEEVYQLAAEVMTTYARHQPLLEARVKVDLIFAHPDYDDETGEPKNDAIKHHGVKALGVARAVPLKDRAMGRGDAEITLDADWYNSVPIEKQKALIDHELYHLEPQKDPKSGRWKVDDLERPKIKLRPHDYEFGWFAQIAADHGENSIERVQARRIMQQSGQMFWPEILEAEAQTQPA